MSQDDGDHKAENTDTLVGETGNEIEDDTVADEPVLDAEIPKFIEQENSADPKADEQNTESEGGISSEYTAEDKSYDKVPAAMNKNIKSKVSVEEPKEDDEDSSKVESEDKDNMDKDPHFDVNKTDIASEDSKSASDKDESKSEEIPKCKQKKNKKKQSVKNPDKDNDKNKSKPTGKDTSKKEGTNTVQPKTEVHNDDEEGLDFGYFCDKCNTKFTD